MMMYGPNDKNNELSDNEQLQIIEAYAEAEECLETSWDEEDYLFEPIEN